MGSKELPKNLRSHSRNQKCLVPEREGLSPLDRARLARHGGLGYKKEFAEIAFKTLASDEAKTKTHLCIALHCSKMTILRWMKEYPEFKEAVETGLQVGEAKWRDRLRENAFEPTKDVNNGLIKLLSSNVYGMKEEPDFVIHNTINNNTPEEEMKKRGIPVPEVDIDDINSEEE